MSGPSVAVLGENVLIQPEVRTETESGIQLAPGAAVDPELDPRLGRGTIVRWRGKSGTSFGDNPVPLNEGARVIYTLASSQEITIDSVKYAFVPARDILAYYTK